jgi:hypothetical protein
LRVSVQCLHSFVIFYVEADAVVQATVTNKAKKALNYHFEAPAKAYKQIYTNLLPNYSPTVAQNNFPKNLISKPQLCCKLNTKLGFLRSKCGRGLVYENPQNVVRLKTFACKTINYEKEIFVECLCENSLIKSLCKFHPMLPEEPRGVGMFDKGRA